MWNLSNESDCDHVFLGHSLTCARCGNIYSPWIVKRVVEGREGKRIYPGPDGRYYTLEEYTAKFAAISGSQYSDHLRGATGSDKPEL